MFGILKVLLYNIYISYLSLSFFFLFSASCIPSQDETPPFALVLNAQRDGKVVEAESNVGYHGSESSLLSSHLASGVTLTTSQVVHILNEILITTQPDLIKSCGLT